ncbi:MAG: MAPEG family protein [Sphingomonadaceae bacterium]|nr:MAPEG family protein [Sphingomonadaceae bacterium]
MLATTITAGFCGLLYFILSLRVIALRQAHGVSLGDGGNTALLARIRAHANFAEYVPIILILMGLIETRTGTTEVLTASGVLLFLIRIAHAVGMALPAPNPWRMAGTGGTWVILSGLSAWALVLAYTHG